MSRKMLAAMILAVVPFAVPAQAATLLYTLEGTTANTWSASFRLDTGRTPAGQTASGIIFNNTPITYTRPGSGTASTLAAGFVTFATLADQGGLRFRTFPGSPRTLFAYGPQLYTVTGTARSFATGTFDLSDRQRIGIDDPIVANYRLTVSDLSAAVPEPATWALMLAGFGATGVALRRRSRERVVA